MSQLRRLPSGQTNHSRIRGRAVSECESLAVNVSPDLTPTSRPCLWVDTTYTSAAAKDRVVGTWRSFALAARPPPPLRLLGRAYRHRSSVNLRAQPCSACRVGFGQRTIRALRGSTTLLLAGPSVEIPKHIAVRVTCPAFFGPSES